MNVDSFAAPCRVRRRAFVLAALLAGTVAAPPAQAFWNPFKKLEALIQKLNNMNQGATIKDRWNNLVTASAAPLAAGGSTFAADVVRREAPGELRADHEELPDEAPAAAGGGSADLAGLMRASVDGLEGLAEEEQDAARASLTEAWASGVEGAVRREDRALTAALVDAGGPLLSKDPAAMRRLRDLLADQPGGEALLRSARRSANASAWRRRSMD